MSASLTEVEDWDRRRLIDAWRTVFGTPPPTRVRTEFLRRAIAWQIQAGWNGSRRPSRVVPRVQGRQSGHAPGTRLIREWQGKTYQVLVTADGFEWDGRRFKSLSAIARTITGTRWSGPAFFGVGR